MTIFRGGFYCGFFRWVLPGWVVANVDRYPIFYAKKQKFSFAPSAHRKMVDFLHGAPKTYAGTHVCNDM